MSNVVPFNSDTRMLQLVRASVRTQGTVHTVEMLRTLFSELSDTSFNGEDNAISGHKNHAYLDETRMALDCLLQRIRKY